MVLKVICIFLVFAGACIMTSSIVVYGKTIKSYTDYLTPGKGRFLNLHNSIMILMMFFLMGYLATLFSIIKLDSIDMAISLIAVIFFFGAIFCFSVVYVQSEQLNRLKQSANVLRDALEESRNANLSLESLNQELVATMEALKNAQNHLVFSEKMSTLGKLVAGISHEINTPVGVVRASAQSIYDAFAERYSFLYREIRALSEKDFDDYLHFAGISVANTKRCTSTLKVREHKRKARKTLADLEGYDEEFLDLLERTCLLDDETIGAIALRLDSEEFVKLLYLVGETVAIIKSLDNIIVSTERIIKLASSLKAFSHFNAISERTEFSVVHGIETILSIYSVQLRQNIEVTTDFDVIPNIIGYEDELSQVWNNLVQNAIYAMQNEVDVSSEDKRPGKLSITAKKQGSDIIVSVSDNGCGIAPDKITDIFEPFYTTKPTGIGSGLGLSISKQIIEKHNGSIWAESEEGRGTTFIVKLPMN